MDSNSSLHQAYQHSIDEVFHNVHSKKKGLTSKEAKQRLEQNGPNSLPQKKQKPIYILFLEQFKSVLVLILIFAVAISMVVGKILDASIILVILTLIAFFGFFQELSARKSLDALNQMQKGVARVYRDNKLITIESTDLVVGDIIFCEAGDKVPADCRIIEYIGLQVEESQLTGESVPVSKQNKKITKKCEIADQDNMLFKSTHISTGNCLAVVVKIGEDTEIGKISKSLQQEEQQTPLQIKLDGFAKKLGMYVILICSILVIVFTITEQLYLNFSLETMLPILLVAIALAVGAVPEGLPAIITITLSIGMKRLLKKHALVRNLSSVETLGSCTIICSDKTGTLTKNEMTITTINTPHENEISVEGIGYTPVGKLSNTFENQLFFNCANYCNTATLFEKEQKWQITGDPTEGALLVLNKKIESTNKLKENKNTVKIDEIPFDSSRKLMSVLIQESTTSKKYFQYTKGALDELLQICTHYRQGNKNIKLSKEKIKEFSTLNEHYSNKALRVIALSYKETSSKKCSENNLVYLGLVAMIDPERTDAKLAIAQAKDAGIRTIMITGDHVITAKAIAKNLGIEGDALSGVDIDSLDDLELSEKLEHTNIFARVNPEHKMRLVTLLQNKQEIVSMTGDGVNDAPALKTANIGVALGSGTDVAKEAGDIVLLNDSFSTITSAIKEGRTIYQNIQKALMFFLSGNISQVAIIFIAILLGFNLPLTAFMLLWINLVTDGAPALALAFDKTPKGIMKLKPQKTQKILPKVFWKYLLTLCSFVVIIGTSLFAYFQSIDVMVAQTMVFSFIVFAKCLIAFLVRIPFNNEPFSNTYLIYAVSISVLLQLIILYTPLHLIFNVAPLSFVQFMIVIAATVVFAMASLIYTYIFKENQKHKN